MSAERSGTQAPSDAHALNAELSLTLGIETPPTIVAQPVGSIVACARFTSRSPDRRIVSSPPVDDYLVVLALADNPARDVRYDGRELRRAALKAGEFHLVDRDVENVVDMEMVFDNLHMQFPKSALKAIASELNVNAVSSLRLDYEDSKTDPVVINLARSLLPALQHPGHANQLFLDSVATALLCHLLSTYGESAGAEAARGGLTLRQLRRAQQMMVSNLEGDFTLETLAAACGLSRAHFARAFKCSTGLPPHQWLVQQRIERAKTLLLSSRKLLAEIAQECGFADQSHFTRSFAKAMRITPSEWRRRQ